MTVPQHQEAVARHSHAVEQVAEQIKQVIHNAFRPIPIETGDGTEVVKIKATGALKDLACLKLEDPETLFEMALDKATGANVDDRTYIMERVIEVCLWILFSQTPVPCHESRKQIIKSSARIVRPPCDYYEHP